VSAATVAFSSLGFLSCFLRRGPRARALSRCGHTRLRLYLVRAQRTHLPDVAHHDHAAPLGLCRRSGCRWTRTSVYPCVHVRQIGPNGITDRPCNIDVAHHDHAAPLGLCRRSGCIWTLAVGRFSPLSVGKEPRFQFHFSLGLWAEPLPYRERTSASQLAAC
jgi:hypothetical protein